MQIIHVGGTVAVALCFIFAVLCNPATLLMFLSLLLLPIDVLLYFHYFYAMVLLTHIFSQLNCLWQKL